MLLNALKFPLWLITSLLGKRTKKRISEREKKQRAYVRNFSVKNTSWQKSLGKYKGKKKSKFFRKKD